MFRLIDMVSADWKRFGHILRQEPNLLDAWEAECLRKAGQCWYKVMEHWLTKDNASYHQTTWEGLISLLEDAEYSEVAKKLEIALTSYVNPSTIMKPAPPAPSSSDSSDLLRDQDTTSSELIKDQDTTSLAFDSVEHPSNVDCIGLSVFSATASKEIEQPHLYSHTRQNTSPRSSEPAIPPPPTVSTESPVDFQLSEDSGDKNDQPTIFPANNDKPIQPSEESHNKDIISSSPTITAETTTEESEPNEHILRDKGLVSSTTLSAETISDVQHHPLTVQSSGEDSGSSDAISSPAAG